MSYQLSQLNQNNLSDRHQRVNFTGHFQQVKIKQQCRPFQAQKDDPSVGRRNVLRNVAEVGIGFQLLINNQAQALPGFQKNLDNPRIKKIPLDKYQDGPEGLKFVEVSRGDGRTPADIGQRVVVHYDVRWKGITVGTTRQGLGVSGGNPQGFTVGAKTGDPGSASRKFIDLGVRGMREGGKRKFIVPPELGYGNKQAGEIPPNSTLEADIELLSIKKDSIGFRTKVVEG